MSDACRIWSISLIVYSWQYHALRTHPPSFALTLCLSRSHHTVVLLSALRIHRALVLSPHEGSHDCPDPSHSLHSILHIQQIEPLRPTHFEPIPWVLARYAGSTAPLLRGQVLNVFVVDAEMEDRDVVIESGEEVDLVQELADKTSRASPEAIALSNEGREMKTHIVVLPFLRPSNPHIRDPPLPTGTRRLALLPKRCPINLPRPLSTSFRSRRRILHSLLFRNS